MDSWARTNQPEGGGIVFDPYQKIIHFSKRESRAIGRPKWIAYQNGTKATTTIVVIYWNNLVVTTKFGGGLAKSRC